jgi:uncharacterized RDD family membrane protein YckC
MDENPKPRARLADFGSRIGSIFAAVIIAAAYVIFVIMVGFMFTQVLLAIVNVSP